MTESNLPQTSDEITIEALTGADLAAVAARSSPADPIGINQYGVKSTFSQV